MFAPPARAKRLQWKIAFSMLYVVTSTLYIEHTNEATKQKKTVDLSMLYIEEC